MASITIRNLDNETKRRLRIRAAHHERSMEEEVRDILTCTLAREEAGSKDMLKRIHKRFATLGGVELEIPKRESLRTPPKF